MNDIPKTVMFWPTYWPFIVSKLDLRGIALHLAWNCLVKCVDHKSKLVHLQLDPNFAYLQTRNAEKRLRDALARCFMQPDLRLLISVTDDPS